MNHQDSECAAPPEAGEKASESPKPPHPDSRRQAHKFHRRKWLLVAAAALALIAMAAGLWWPTTVDVEVATAQVGELTVTVNEQGHTRAKLHYTIAAPVGGRLLRPQLHAGDRVTRGDVLARMAPPPQDARSEAIARSDLAAAKARLSEAQAAVSEARGNQELAQDAAARRAALYAKGVVSLETRDLYNAFLHLAGARLASAQAAVVAANAQVESARARLIGSNSQSHRQDLVDVRAPASGTVLHVLQKSERVIPSGTPLFDLSNGNALELVIDVLTEDAAHVRAGNPIHVTGWGGDATLQATVSYVEPSAFTKVSALGVEEQRVNVIGDLADPPRSLGVQFRIDASIVTWSGRVLRIPNGAMFRRDGAWQVFAVKDGRARLRKLKVGHRGQHFTEVKSGLAAGDSVILFPSDQVADGVRVHPQR